ncbi:monooxygenase [Gammaproteobacteria bacterium 45_16_T64]|nr:monooxygenase [Gammaproteobacteria bacterium 45_16_T64]
MRNYQVIIIGSGFGGQCAAINLKKHGIEDFLILERRSFMGGTWCQNSYPGAAVDVQSPLYSISSEPYDWSQMFVEQKELEEYTNYVIDKHQLRSKTALDSNVTKTQWNEEEHVWEIHTSGNDPYKAQFIINASGPLSTPVIPNFPGKDSFKGESFHTNNWNHDFDYKGKRVAIIGSGASAAQAIPAIAGDVSELHVFQRTPHWVMPRPDRVFSKVERKLLKNKRAYKSLRQAIYWGLETRVVGFKYSDLMLKAMAQRKAEKHIRSQIADPTLRAKVTPDYTIGCKRVILSDTLYPALCRDNVSLHSKEQGIKEITDSGIITQDGEEIELDLIVYSTGYDATDGVISYPVIGKDKRELSDFWDQFPRAYLGTCVPGFPNLFIVTGPNTGIGHTSAIFVIEAQMNYIVNSLNELKKRNNRSIEVKADAEQRYTTHIHQEMDKTVWKSGGCTSWYQSKSGHVIAMFPGFSFTYERWTKNFRSADHDFA